MTYWILPHPGASAVFFGASQTLAMAELTLCLRTLETPCSAPRITDIAGRPWYAFDAETELTGRDLSRLGRLSSLYALFAGNETALTPLDPGWRPAFPEDLSAILKYTGKTNALFTRLMLHIA